MYDYLYIKWSTIYTYQEGKNKWARMFTTKSTLVAYKMKNIKDFLCLAMDFIL